MEVDVFYRMLNDWETLKSKQLFSSHTHATQIISVLPRIFNYFCDFGTVPYAPLITGTALTIFKTASLFPMRLFFFFCLSFVFTVYSHGTVISTIFLTFFPVQLSDVDILNTVRCSARF